MFSLLFAFLLARRPRKGVSVWISENKGSNRCKLNFCVLCVFELYRCLSASVPSIDSWRENLDLFVTAFVQFFRWCLPILATLPVHRLYDISNICDQVFFFWCKRPIVFSARINEKVLNSCRLLYKAWPSTFNFFICVNIVFPRNIIRNFYVFIY